MTAWRRCLGLVALFVVLTVSMTWPQALVLGTRATGDQDVFFSIWRLRWFAHALATAPSQLFNGNIFHPEQHVLAYSDAMLVEGAIAAPLDWIGVPPVLVHNLLLLGAIVASAVGIALLARHLTGSTGAGVLAGVVFAFAPYRFDHYHHLELQWTVWTPPAFWALQRTLETGSLRFAILTGICVTLQMASSVYYGLFLFMLIAAVAAVQLVPLRGPQLMERTRNFAVAGAIAAAFAFTYSIPYAAAAERVGTRTKADVTTFSARPGDYLAVTPTNLLYGDRHEGIPERRLFPGVVALLLALIGLLLVPPTTVTFAYVIGLILAFELSLGAFGIVYPALYEHVPAFRAMRAPARASAFVLFFLGVLAARGLAALAQPLSVPLRRALTAVACASLLLEYWVAPLKLDPYYNEPPALYRYLAQLPRGVVAEFPMPARARPPGHDPRYAFMSTFHWMRTVNGYSGFLPPSYLERLAAMTHFPDEGSLAALRRDGVRYVVVHADGYPPGERERIVERLLRFGLQRLAEFEDGWGMATIMELP